MDKLEEVHQYMHSYDAICSRTTKHDFVKFSKKTSKKYFEDKNSINLNNIVRPSKNLSVNICFCYRFLYID